MPNQAPLHPVLDAPVVPAPSLIPDPIPDPTPDRRSRPLLRLDAAWRLGPRPVGLFLWHRAAMALGVPAARLRNPTAIEGPILPPTAPPAPPLPEGEAARLLRAAAALPEAPDWHGPFDPTAPAIGMDLFRPGDVRPVWERHRFADVLLLAQGARIDPAGGHLARAEALLHGWAAANPAFRGPAWACGQEAALRALTLALILALLDADRGPPKGGRALLGLLSRRIAATPAYAAAQDNNHAISEPAGSFACALLLGDQPGAALAGRRLAAAVARLVAPDGGFAQVSAGYARLALDTLSVAEWLRRRHGAPPFPAPLPARAAALAAWLHRVVAADGTGPALGVEDGSALADLGLHGPADARGSVERAARLFADASSGAMDDAGAAWLGLPCPAARLDRPARWVAAGTMGWRAGGATALLRTGPLRFRPAQSDLLHLTLRDGATTVLRDGGTGSYNPPSPGWWPGWWDAIAGAAAHNAPVFDGQDPMPRAGRFLLARWPRLGPLPDGAWRRDSTGNSHDRRLVVDGRCWMIEDLLSGPFRQVALHWRLCPGDWRLTDDGVAGPAATLRVTADAPLSLRLAGGWESPAYGALRPVPLLVVTAAAPVSRIVTAVMLPPAGRQEDAPDAA